MRQFQRKFLFLFALFEKEENKREKKTREVDRLRKDQRHLLRQKQKQKQRQRERERERIGRTSRPAPTPRRGRALCLLPLHR